MNSVALVLPYYGQFPDYAGAFFQSVRCNPSFDLLLVSDIPVDDFALPDNVIVINLSFKDLQERLYKIVAPDACLPFPYKLCDYKALYGLLFERELAGYGWWGHCDMDMLWGRLDQYVTAEMLGNYDKLFNHGHLTLYRNAPEVNELALRYRKEPGGLDEVASTGLCCYFDEVGIVQIARRAGLRIYDDPDFADITPARYVLSLASTCKQRNKRGQRFFWDRGRVCRMSEESPGIDEFMYIHFQKRPMAVHVDVFKDTRWQVREEGIYLPSAPSMPSTVRLGGAVRQCLGFQLSRLKRLSPERISLSWRIKWSKRSL